MKEVTCVRTSPHEYFRISDVINPDVYLHWTVTAIAYWSAMGGPLVLQVLGCDGPTYYYFVIISVNEHNLVVLKEFCSRKLWVGL